MTPQITSHSEVTFLVDRVGEFRTLNNVRKDGTPFTVLKCPMTLVAVLTGLGRVFSAENKYTLWTSSRTVVDTAAQLILADLRLALVNPAAHFELTAAKQGKDYLSEVTKQMVTPKPEVTVWLGDQVAQYAVSVPLSSKDDGNIRSLGFTASAFLPVDGEPEQFESVTPDLQPF